jgi:hypothetical protein
MQPVRVIRNIDIAAAARNIVQFIRSASCVERLLFISSLDVLDVTPDTPTELQSIKSSIRDTVKNVLIKTIIYCHVH